MSFSQSPNPRLIQKPSPCLTSLSVKTNQMIIKPTYTYNINPGETKIGTWTDFFINTDT